MIIEHKFAWICLLVSASVVIVVLGCVIPPFLSQIISASISFVHLQFQDTQNIIIFSEKDILDLPQDPHKSKKVDFQVAPITLLMVL